MQERRIGLYGGTFNPVHFGHLNLAIELKEKGGLDEVWVIPAALSPLRQNEELAGATHRLNMAKLGFEQIPGFQVLDLELKRPPPSYTVETVNEILGRYPKDRFFLLLGEDSVLQFAEWKEISTIVARLPLLIGYRGEFLSSQLEAFPFEVRTAVANGRIETARFEISATTIRNRLKKRLYCGHLVPAKVLDYIFENQLYFAI